MRLVNLANTVSGSATFRKLVGATTEQQALQSIYIDLALDDSTQPFPRAIVRHHSGAVAVRSGMETFLAHGDMLIFVQLHEFTDDDLAAWYDISGPFTAADHRQHLNNLFGSMTDEFSALAASPGYIEFQRIEEHSCGAVDPVTENGVNLLEMTWCLGREGMP